MRWAAAKHLPVPLLRGGGEEGTRPPAPSTFVGCARDVRLAVMCRLPPYALTTCRVSQKALSLPVSPPPHTHTQRTPLSKYLTNPPTPACAWLAGWPAQADIFSLAVIMWTLLTREAPWRDFHYAAIVYKVAMQVSRWLQGVRDVHQYVHCSGCMCCARFLSVCARHAHTHTHTHTVRCGSAYKHCEAHVAQAS